MLDTLGINHLKNNGQSDKFYIVKIFSTFGHMVAYIPGILIGDNSYFKLLKEMEVEGLRNILGALYGIIAIIIVYVSGISYTKKYDSKIDKSRINNHEHSTEFETRPLMKKLKSLLISPYFFFIIAVLSQGINRSTTTALLRVFQKRIGFSLASSNLIAIARLTLEIIVYFTLGRFKNPKYIYYFFSFCVFVANIRPLLIFTANPTDLKTMMRIKFMSAEVAKALFSSFYSFSSVRIAENLAGSDSKTLAQGIATGIYSGFGSVPYVIIGLLVYNIDFKSAKNIGESSDAFEIRKIKTMLFISVIIGFIGGIVSLILLGRMRSRIKNSPLK